MGTQSERQNDNINIAFKHYIENPSEYTLTELLSASTPLIKHFAFCYSGGVHYTDAIQAGYEGVLKAAKRFNTKYNTTFATYAGHCIAGEIRHYVRKEMRFYKPAFLTELQKKAQGFIGDYYNENSEVPSNMELAKELNIKEDGVKEVIRAGLVSIDQLDFDKISTIRYESFKLPIEDKIVLFEAIQKLSKIKRDIIFNLFFRNKTQQQTADSLSINQRKVSRLLKSSLLDLKKYLDK